MRNVLVRQIAFLLAILFVGHQSILAQTDSSSFPMVRIKSRVQKDKVLIRWAVDEAKAWRKANDYGFELKKYLYVQNGKKLPSPKLIWQKPFKADPLQEWEAIVNENDYAAIIAQSLYGESFVVEENDGGELANIVNLAQEAEQRFSFALLAADMNFQAAQKAGWGFIDNELKKGESYVYQVKTLVPKNILEIRSSSTLVNLKDYEELPSPIDFQGIFDDKVVNLSWEYALFRDIYTAYFIERSVDGKTFEQISGDRPVMNLNDSPETPSKQMFYIDSLADNNTTYYYRIRGVTTFGEKGQYSKVISGKGKNGLTHTPRISNYSFTESPNEAIIEWTYPEEAAQDVKEFQLLRADQDAGPYETIAKGLPNSARKLTYSNLNPSNYVKVKAIGQIPNQERTSYSTLIQPIDSIPPNPPIELKGKIDSLGIVRFDWKANEEKDIDGYRIYRAFNEKEEMSPLTRNPFPENNYVDSVALKSLNSKVYYKVVAVDKRFNHSDYSQVLILEKPDIIPPTAPAFKNYKVEDGKVLLEWANSSDSTAINILYRQDLNGKNTAEEVFRTDSLQQYTDAGVESEALYKYTLKAIDPVGLESNPSAPLTIQVVNLKPQEIIKDFNSFVDRQNNYLDIFWRANDPTIVEYTVCKQKNDEPPSTWKVLPPNITRLTDQNIQAGNTYTYHLRASLKNGKFAQIEKIEINY